VIGNGGTGTRMRLTKRKDIRASKVPVPLTHRCSIPDYAEEDPTEEPADPSLPGKWMK